MIVGLALICRSAYRGVVEFLRDLLGLPVSIGTVHHVLRPATRQAGVINHDEDLSGIRVGLHDEIFQGATPVLAGVDAASTYCYLLTAEKRRDADTWGVHLLDAAEQGLDPDYTIADAGQGLRAGQTAAWGATPCHGDVFPIQRQCEGLAATLSRLAKGATSRRRTLQARIGHSGQHVLALAGPALATRRELFDFIVEELARREPGDARRIRPVRVALQNQRDTLLAFVGVLSTPSWPRSRKPTPSPSPSCARPACCTAYAGEIRPPSRPHTGRGGTGFARRLGASSTRSSPP